MLSAERGRTLAMAVRRRASSIYSLDRGFEEVGCTCSPYRDRLKELEVSYARERQRLLESLEDSALATELYDLRRTVAEMDREQHPGLNVQARQAHYFVGVWLMDQVREGDGEVLGLDDQAISKAYAEAWLDGWRPRAEPKRKQSASSRGR